ncbi:dihydroxyacetone kinase subunit L [Halorubrum sp. CBA1125]|uniref:dihydroxyacetone kinase subunit DhaL n=1 Tax=Halorubrum sp. CBA1125 TaxID=2668072 RepID=UPI0012E8BB67|nr:dihydroxyacetone kinase subunit DhaL [Halorubrum sp. CBA1125]MUW13687.1 dihydroxyacetone kinase subunit L [Halorubrum sp. CBA1125]
MTDDTTLVVEAVERVADRLVAAEPTLTELDSQIGDADFGVNLRRGLTAVTETVKTDEFNGPDDVLDTVGRTLISEMAGSSGILFGKSLMEASDTVTDGIDYEAIVAFAVAYSDNVATQGDVTLGSKTMFDAIRPAVYALKRGQELDDVTPTQASAHAVKACEYGVGFTIPLRAKKGRASYTEWRSVGYPDPGAVAVLLILREIHDLVEQEHDETVEPSLPGDLDDVL